MIHQRFWRCHQRSANLNCHQRVYQQYRQHTHMSILRLLCYLHRQIWSQRGFLTHLPPDRWSTLNFTYVHKQFPVIPKRSSSIKRWRNWDMLPVRNSILLQVTMETIKPLTQQRKNERSPSQPSCQITSRHCKVSISFSFKILKCLASKEMGQTSVTFTPPLALVWSHILYIHMYTYIYIYKWVAKYTRLCCTSLY